MDNIFLYIEVIITGSLEILIFYLIIHKIKKFKEKRSSAIHFEAFDNLVYSLFVEKLINVNFNISDLVWTGRLK